MKGNWKFDRFALLEATVMTYAVEASLSDSLSSMQVLQQKSA